MRMVDSRQEKSPRLSLGPKDPRILRLAEALGVPAERTLRLCGLLEHIFRILAFNHGFKISRFEMSIWIELLTDYLEGGALPERERIEDLFPGAYSERDW
jgi:hypothetical protein